MSHPPLSTVPLSRVLYHSNSSLLKTSCKLDMLPENTTSIDLACLIVFYGGSSILPLQQNYKLIYELIRHQNYQQMISGIV